MESSAVKDIVASYIITFCWVVACVAAGALLTLLKALGWA